MNDRDTKGLRFAIFARVSTADQLTGHSLDVQQKTAREYVGRVGGVVTQVYAGQESARKAQEDRVVLTRLLAGAEQGLFDAVVFQETSRLSRDLGVMLGVRKDLLGKGITLHDFSGPLPLNTAQGKLFSNMQAVIGEFTAEQGAEKSIESRQTVMRNGGIAAGRPPFGRKWNKEAKRFEIIPERRAQLKRAFDVIVRQGRSMRKAAAQLGMGESSLRKAIAQAALTEIKQHLNGEEFTIPCPPLLTVEQQSQLLQRLAANATVRPESKGEYLLQGLVRCAGCGGSMSGQTSKKDGRKYSIYRHPVPGTGKKLPSGCTWGVPVKLIDDDVLSACAAIVENGGALRSAISAALVQANSGQADLAERAADVKRLIATAVKKMDQQTDALVDSEKGSEAREQIQQKIKRTERTLADLRAEHAELSGQLAVIELPKGGADAIAAKLRSLYWHRGAGPAVMLPFAKRKEFVRLIVGRNNRESPEGVFVKMGRPPGGTKKDVTWAYELRGCVGIADGLVTPNPDWESFPPEVRDLRVAPDAVQQLASLAAATPGIQPRYERKSRINPSSGD